MFLQDIQDRTQAMADVRSMLRAERASRRITHPNASYTSDGKLLCNLCETMVKSEAAWQGHLHSTGHTLRLSRAQEAAAARRTDVSSKKRKAATLESPEADERKRAKPGEGEAEVHDVSGGEALPLDDVAKEAPAGPKANGSSTRASPGVGPSVPVDESELAAFERDLASLEASDIPTTALNADATISAAPMTAKELAKQAREEQSAQRGKRDVEIEAEREDAARLLEDEFEEMEGLEERVRKLRERREALRKGSNAASERADAVIAGAEALGDGETVEDGDDEEVDDDFDEWGFRGS